MEIDKTSKGPSVELSAAQEQEIKGIMADSECPKGFECYASKFEGVCPIGRRYGTDLIECKSPNGQHCPMSFVFGHNLRFCRCKLRKYAAFQLQR
jgi:hypothetical protein